MKFASELGLWLVYDVLIARKNKAGYTATPVASGWAGAIFEVNRAFGQEQRGQGPHKHNKSIT